jgi:hypothetical protein
MAETLNLGGGKLYIRRYKDDGSLDVKRYFGKTDSITLTTKTDYIEHENTESKFATTDFKAVKKKSATLKFTTSEITADMLALALNGSKAETVVDAGSVTAEEHPASEVVGGAYVTLGHNLVSNVVVKYTDGSGNEQTAVEGTDYKVDTAENGMLYIIEGGAIDGKDIKVDYDYAGVTIAKIEALVKNAVLAELQFYNEPQVGDKIFYRFYKVQLQQEGDIALKSADKFITITFNGEVLNTGNDETPFFETKVIRA